MAYLLNLESGKTFPLAEHHTFGRLATSVNTHLDRPCVSKVHAAIVWDGAAWHIKNLGLNGTWLNERQLQEGDAPELAINDHIRLAEIDDPGFRVLDLAPPADMLWPLNADQQLATGERQPIYLERYHLLPNSQSPRIAVYFDEQQQSWFKEDLQNSDHSQPLTNSETLWLDGEAWQLWHTPLYGPTEARVGALKQLKDHKFVFHLSADEESTHLELHRGKQVVDLGHRTHHYLLLHLARLRLMDAKAGLSASNQGWVYSDQLTSDLGIETTHINIQIFRARKQFSDTLTDVLGIQQLLERRGGKIRFGCDQFTIFKDDVLLAESTASEFRSSVNE
jgi:pSer/pThr/pTyr-binding forkhead associated (FHA) protein